MRNRDFPHPRLLILSAVTALCLWACAVNRFAAIPIGSDVETVQAKLGKPYSRILAPEYMLLVYEAGSSPNLAVLKFVAGRLESKGAVPRWVFNSGRSGGKSMPEARSYYAMAIRLNEQGLEQEGYALMRRFVAEHPDSVNGHLYLHFLFKRDSLFDSGAAVYERALAMEKNPRNRATLKTNSIGAYIEARDFASAERVGLEVLADTVEDLKAPANYNLACSFSIQNRKPEAIKHLRGILGKTKVGYTRRRLDADPDMDNIRQEPGYKEIRAKLPEGEDPKVAKPK